MSKYITILSIAFIASIKIANANPCTASANTAARMIITGGANGYKELDDAASSVTMTDANVVQYNNHNICMGTLNTSKFKTRSLWVPIGKAPNQTVEIIQALDPNYMVATQESVDDYNNEQERQKEENAKWREQTQAKIQKENHKNKLMGGLGGLLQDLTQ